LFVAHFYVYYFSGSILVSLARNSGIYSTQSSPPVENSTLQRQNAENLKQIFPGKEYRGLSPNFHIHVSVSELYIACSAGGNMWTDPGNI
jgi:hypothetical protein